MRIIPYFISVKSPQLILIALYYFKTCDGNNVEIMLYPLVINALLQVSASKEGVVLFLLMATLDGNTKTLLPVSELPCILSLIQ